MLKTFITTAFSVIFMNACTHFQPQTEEKRITMKDGTQVWFKVFGPSIKQVPTAIYLHGGPGYNSHTFEMATRDLFKDKIRIVYLDQRGGAGRTKITSNADLSLDMICSDIEEVRKNVGVSKIDLIGHSFGGIVALEFAKRYPNSVRKIILVDIAADLPSAFEQQVRTAYMVSKREFPQLVKKLKKIVASDKKASEKLGMTYETVTRIPLQRQILYYTGSAQEKMEKWDDESGLMKSGGDSAEKFYKFLSSSGYLDDHHVELRKKIEVPAILFAGKHSHCIGLENINRAAKEWGIPVKWFDKSGHFVYLEEPEKFVSEATEFLSK